MVSKATIRLPDGQKIEYFYQAPYGHFWQQHITHKVRERSLREDFFFPRLAKNKYIIDVGAAYGSWSLPSAILGGHVYAFEPRPEVADVLASNFELNGLENWTVFPYAVGDHEAETTLCNSGNSTTIREGQQHVACSSHETVHETTIDSIVAQYAIPQVDWIKIDAEGVELQVLRGAAATIQRFRPNLIVECHQGHDESTLELVIAFVESTGLQYDFLAASFGWKSGDRPHAVFLRPEESEGPDL